MRKYYDYIYQGPQLQGGQIITLILLIIISGSALFYGALGQNIIIGGIGFLLLGVAAIIFQILGLSQRRFTGYPEMKSNYAKSFYDDLRMAGWNWNNNIPKLPYRFLIEGFPLATVDMAKSMTMQIIESEIQAPVKKFKDYRYIIRAHLEKEFNQQKVELTYFTSDLPAGLLMGPSFAPYVMAQMQPPKPFPGWVRIRPRSKFFPDLNKGLNLEDKNFDEVTGYLSSDDNRARQLFTSEFQAWYKMNGWPTIFLEQSWLSIILDGQPPLGEVEKLPSMLLEALKFFEQSA